MADYNIKDINGIPFATALEFQTVFDGIQNDISDLNTDLDLKAPLAGPTFTGTVTLPAGQEVNGITLVTDGGENNFLRADGSYATPPGTVTAADELGIDDVGGYYTSDNAEGALQEVGSDLTVLNSAGTIITDATTARTLALTDASKYIMFTSASAITVTVPPNSSVAFTIGDEIAITAYGTGTVTIVGGSGVTVNSKGSNMDIDGQYAVVGLKKIAEDEWQLFGSLI